jgi:phenylacetaldehyde dehydrogenase
VQSTELVQITPDVTAFLRREPSLFIDGRRTAPTARATLPVFNPADGTQIAQVPDAGATDVAAAVQSAHSAFADGRWRKLRPADRERILLRFADLVERNAESLAQLETLEQGKSINISRAVEVGGSVEYMRYVAGLATKITGMTLDVSMPAPPGGRYTAYTRREPVGVVAAIAPWNFPLAIAIWKIMPSLAAGCTLVLKPSEFTPLTALWLAELALEAGVPPGVFNVITGSGSSCGQALVSSPLVSKISFTGSTATGKAIGRLAVENMTRVSLELGGKNPAIVLKDADLNAVAGGLMMGAFLNQGQVCAAASRVYVEAPLFDKVAEALAQAVTSLSMGPGLDQSAQVNPLVSATHQSKVLGFVEEAQKAGAKLVQGTRVAQGKGYYVNPTLLLNPDKSLRLTREEVFGPVLALTRVADAEEALALANDSAYGLAASLWTRDLKATLDLVPRIEAGTVWVNSHVPIDPNLPFGGFKQSGVGRDFGPRWLDGYTEEKAVCIAH